MATYRAAYLKSDPTSNGVGVRLTGPEHSDLPDAELLALARAELAKIGESRADADIEIGDWTE
ncbi:Uncharacterised protein [Burkholderia pseudomallei]|uniref:hypothetical protein n=1 Tax=Burkholderia pseudomallei TaxID=28450 RepID=UPI0005E1A42C|nr:hypothetical protein [Burkholderia pseudomallei]CAK1277419.1 Uncharacterised protein [Burkholderia pseudomallei]